MSLSHSNLARLRRLADQRREPFAPSSADAQRARRQLDQTLELALEDLQAAQLEHIRAGLEAKLSREGR